MNETIVRRTEKELVDRLAEIGVMVLPRQHISGPTVTRYELELAPGVRVGDVQRRAPDLGYVTGSPVRISQGSPRRLAVEVPNVVRDTVPLTQVIGHCERGNPLSVPFGVDAAGKAVVEDIGELPHLLVGGETGSGKSIFIRCLLTTWAVRTRPSQLQLLLIDPKRVEFSAFASLPHLIRPVVKDPREAIDALTSVMAMVEDRYDRIEQAGARDIAAFNERTDGPPLIPLVVVVDECADLFATQGEGVENVLCRIAQLGRAAGVHLILATQRPSADTFPTRIRANVPARMAFAVGNYRDSMVILDTAGAQTLLRKGDGLFRASSPLELVRLQAPFVTETEVDEVVGYWAPFNERLEKARAMLAAGRTLRPSDLAADGSMTEGEARDVMIHLVRTGAGKVIHGAA